MLHDGDTVTTGGFVGIGVAEDIVVAAEEKVIDQPSPLDFLRRRGGLDISVLGRAQADVHGCLNVSKFGTRLAGAGGFINIRQNARTVVFVGTFTAGEQDVRGEVDRLLVVSEGAINKCVKDLEHRTFRSVGATHAGEGRVCGSSISQALPSTQRPILSKWNAWWMNILLFNGHAFGIALLQPGDVVRCR